LFFAKEFPDPPTANPLSTVVEYFLINGSTTVHQTWNSHRSARPYRAFNLKLTHFAAIDLHLSKRGPFWEQSVHARVDAGSIPKPGLLRVTVTS
jgi:hypothetical protein